MPKKRSSKVDLEELTKLALAMLFVAGMGVLAAFFWGYLMIRILFEVFFGY